MPRIVLTVGTACVTTALGVAMILVDDVAWPIWDSVGDALWTPVTGGVLIGTAVLVMRPFEGGTLFDSVRNQPLPEFAEEFASSWSQLFLKFILSHPGVTCVIPATGNPRHMADNVRAGSGKLPTGAQRELLIEMMQGGR